ncbi:hypothetical protein QR665_05785 [Acinetobacter gerneri]|uniref:hypothetical protein n=1 Tax=Acinetobacter gerneri TaxID=202952 RepID=UPI0029364C51|nr:hypothetical protein [Acinetobacter gerneri]MDV2438997.1 hypothetical protein [Acinetobacter gerneri]
MNKLQVSLFSLESLFDKREMWKAFFTNLENIFDLKISHIDKNDPIRNKVKNLDEVADYISVFGGEDTLNILFAKSKKYGLFVLLRLKAAKSTVVNGYDAVYISFNEDFIKQKENLEKVYLFFKESISLIKPFYAVCDDTINIKAKKKSNGFPVNYEEELPGIFWLTYFNKKYSEFFDLKNKNIPFEAVENTSGAILRLGESPHHIVYDRFEAEKELGSKSFVELDAILNKSFGKYVLLFKDLI